MVEAEELLIKDIDIVHDKNWTGSNEPVQFFIFLRNIIQSAN